MILEFDTASMETYRRFLAMKKLPMYRVRGSSAVIPDEYAHMLGGDAVGSHIADYEPSEFLFDYQRDVAAIAIRKQRFAVFADCGLGKTLILLEFAKHCHKVLPVGKKILIVSPLMVVPQTAAEANRFYGNTLPVEIVRSSDVESWMSGNGRICITNYEAITKLENSGDIGALILDESSMLKSMYGKFAQKCIDLGKGVPFKLALTGTPAPNDRIEYGNHAVFLDRFRSTNEFLAKYFINRGETGERWELKPHALRPFYRDLSHWCIFLSNPAIYGWKDNCESLPPINVHIEHVELTAEQIKGVQQVTGGLIAHNPGGITKRSKLARLAKGTHNGEAIKTLKPKYICDRIASWPDESTIVWCRYDDEQDTLASMIPDSVSIDGDTPLERRLEWIDAFKRGEKRVLISKPKILGFGLNLQIATRQMFSTMQDSYEEYYQAVKRSNRYGSTKPLNVHVPVTEIEIPMVETVLQKAGRVQQDTEEQERLFKECGIGGIHV